MKEVNRQFLKETFTAMAAGAAAGLTCALVIGAAYGHMLKDIAFLVPIGAGFGTWCQSAANTKIASAEHEPPPKIDLKGVFQRLAVGAAAGTYFGLMYMSLPKRPVVPVDHAAVMGCTVTTTGQGLASRNAEAFIRR